jgi:hypothetical protein
LSSWLRCESAIIARQTKHLFCGAICRSGRRGANRAAVQRPTRLGGRLPRREWPRNFAAARQPGRTEDQDQGHDDAEADFLRAFGQPEMSRSKCKAGLERSQNLDHERDHDDTDDRAAEAAEAADHQHRERDEGQVEVKHVDRQHAKKMRVQTAADADEKGADYKGNEAHANNFDRTGRGRDVIVARGAEHQPEPRVLEQECAEHSEKNEHEDRPRAVERWNTDNRTRSPRHRLPIGIDAVDDGQKREGRDRGDSVLQALARFTDRRAGS